MSKIKIEDINENNIIEVLEKVGFEFEDAAVLPRELSRHFDCELSDFVVRLDDKFYNVDLTDGPITEEYARKISCKVIGLFKSIGLESHHRSNVVLTTFDGENQLDWEFGSLHIIIPIRSLNGVSLD